MTKEEILSYADSLLGASHDCPFDLDFETTVLRHTASEKWFGVILRAPAAKVMAGATGEWELLNLKCAPEDIPILCELYEGICPAYHMNKRHWISVVLSMSIPDTLLCRLIADSHRLTARRVDREGEKL